MEWMDYCCVWPSVHFLPLKCSICSDHVETKSIKLDQNQFSTNSMTFATKLLHIPRIDKIFWKLRDNQLLLCYQKLEVRSVSVETDPSRHGR